MWAKAQYNLCERFRLFNLEERNGTQNTFLYGVTPSVFKGLQRRTTVYYPIWHGQAPRIISTFLESYDFTGKTIVPFCTSHSSGIGSSATNLHELADDAKWLDGQRFASGTSREEIENWIDSLDIPQRSETVLPTGTFNFETKTVLLNSGFEMPLNGLGTYSLHGDVCVDSVKSALNSDIRLIDTASAYGNEEEVGQAIREAIEEGIIQREDVFVITKSNHLGKAWADIYQRVFRRVEPNEIPKAASEKLLILS